MKITFIGAAHEVTGSMHLLSACGRNILIDCGMEQGTDDYENSPLPIPASDIDAVVLTHAHIDHSGMLPFLSASGFGGRIYSTPATRDLCSVMLRDSASIQESDAEWKNRKARRSGEEQVKPLYTLSDAEKTLKLFSPLPYDEKTELAEGITLRFCDVGHLLGSASAELWINEDGVSEKLVFSGDIGSTDRPILRDPTRIAHGDTVIMEATYGDRDHPPVSDNASELADIISKTLSRGGNVIIPSFAVGRTQEILYLIRRIKAEGLWGDLGDFDVYVDSPLAVEATKIFTKNDIECFDDEAADLVRRGINPLYFPGLRFSETTEQSKQINSDSSPKVIISTSGMCEAGRIRHHLKHNLWRQESTVVFVGYQAHGSLGRALCDGAKRVKLFNETVNVRASIRRLDGISGHADRKTLLNWLGAMEPKPRKVYVVHSEDEVADAFTAELCSLGYNATAPYSGASYDLSSGDTLSEGNASPIQKKSVQKSSDAYSRLVSAAARLEKLVADMKKGTNKDISRLTDQIESILSKNKR